MMVKDADFGREERCYLRDLHRLDREE